MSLATAPRRVSSDPGSDAVAAAALETAAATRMLVAEQILDYSGHLSGRIPGQDAFVIQVGNDSRAEVAPANQRNAERLEIVRLYPRVAQ